jgi:hypothetical protein
MITGMGDVSRVIADLKLRVSLTDVLTAVGVTLRRSGADRWAALCPLHREKTPSFTVYPGRDGAQRFKCWGCGASGDVVDFYQQAHSVELPVALEALMQMAGGAVAFQKILPPKAAVIVAEEVRALAEIDLLKWAQAAAELAGNAKMLAQWAQWRGLSVEVMGWAAGRGLCGTLVYRGEWREAFAIERPREGGGLEQVGWHVRLAPRSGGNAGDRASWRYEPQGIGSWPVVVLPESGMEKVKYVFVCEGQWDVLALVDLMGWHEKWPDAVAVFGLRGATTWRRLLDYGLNEGATVFLLADRDDAGRRWFAGAGCFAEELRKKVRFVYGFWPNVPGVKDLNDAVRAMSVGMRDVVRGELRRKVVADRRGRRVTKPTFFSWSKKQRERDDMVGQFGRWAYAMRGVTPKKRANKTVWLRFMNPHTEAKAWFALAWKEWEAI